VLTLLRDAGRPPPPPAYARGVEAMFDYLALVQDPGGCLPVHGDADPCPPGVPGVVAAYFGRRDWVYIATNGREGTPPAGPTPSRLFPWGGQAVLRSGYGRDATWLWFDVGPYGSSGHWNSDKLAVLLHAHGAALLVDSGRFGYSGAGLSPALRPCGQLPEPRDSERSRVRRFSERTVCSVYTQYFLVLITNLAWFRMGGGTGSPRRRTTR